MSALLKFEVWESSVSADFWQDVAKRKLDLGLSDAPLELQGYFSPCAHPHISVPLQLNYQSLSEELNSVPDRNRCPATGTLYITNTYEDFKNFNRKALVEAEAEKLWLDICSGRAEDDCKLLNRFLVLCHADLKGWKFHYSFYIPAVTFTEPVTSNTIQLAFDYFPAEEHSSVISACKQWRNAPETCCWPFFLLHFSAGGISARPLSDWHKCNQDKLVLCFYDPCHRLTNPGWPLRNFLMMAASRWRLKQAVVLCWREMKGQADLKNSLVISVPLPEVQAGKMPGTVACGQPSRVVDLSSMMDPRSLAISAADLNLKLMKWRHFTTLNLEKLSTCKCLLLGAGTLGCQVSRDLLGWGIRDITFVDYGKVGFSNPPRQSLYQFEDCLNGGRLKAEAAADALRRICVDARSRGEHLAIPMAGHPVADHQMQETLDSFTKLKALVDEHDVIFLLTDTRESRWLPTVLCCASDTPKILVNAALGFDSFVVMRHGDGPLRTAQQPRLGCYFCNDVVAPTNSTINRTLDQQCTVSVPGLASMAASLAVHLAVSIVHHPLGIAAPADEALPLSSSTDQALGILPHQIRGFLSHCTQLPITGYAFESCTACSPKVVSEFKEKDVEFLIQSMNDPKYLEDLTGLTDLLRKTKSIVLDDEDDW